MNKCKRNRLIYSVLTILLLLPCLSMANHKWLSFDTKSTNDFDAARPEAFPSPKGSIHDEILSGCSFEMDFPGVVVSEEERFGNIYSHVNMDKFGKLGQPGAPALPMRIFQIAVPQGATASVKVNKSSKKKEISGYLPFPALEPASDKIGAKEPRFQIDSSVYNGKTLFPEEPVTIIGYRTISGTTIALVRVCPVQYDPHSKGFVVYRNLDFRVSFSGSATEAAPKSRSQQSVLNNIIINPLVISDTRDDIDAVCARLLIVTTNEFKAAADSLALWKKQMGYQVYTVSNASWASSQQVKDTIHLYAKQYNIDFFVIIGDNEDVPSYESNQDKLHVTDLYYACLDGSSDFYPDLGYGRISVSTASEAMIVIKKIVDYERNPVTNAAFYTHACATAYFQDYDDYNSYADRRFAQTAHEMRTSLIKKGYVVDKIFYTEPSVTPLYWNNGSYSNGAPVPDSLRKPTFPWTGNATDISNAINQGRLLVFHRDHGAENRWGDPYYSTSNVSALNNGRLLPVVLSLNCLTGKFDYSSPCFCEIFLRHSNGGAVGIVGATEESYSGSNDGMAEGIIDAIWPDSLLVPDFPHNPNPNLPKHAPIYQMGLVLNQGKLRMSETWNGGLYPRGGEKYSYELFHWFGDPTMRIWTMEPRVITASYENTLLIGQASFSISNASCSTGMATLWLKNSNTILGSAKITGGNTTINFISPLSSIDTAVLTITSQDYRPIQQNVPIMPAGNYIVPLTPITSDTFDFGQIVPISWQTFGTIPNVKLLSGRVNNPNDTIWTTIVTSTANTNSFSWFAPSTAGKYCIKIIGITPPDSTKATTKSFTIMNVSTISGRVLNAANAVIYFGGPQFGSVSENPDSSYSIPHLVPGTYSIYATVGAFSSNVTTVVIPPDSSNLNITILYPGISVTPHSLKEQLNPAVSKVDTLHVTNTGDVDLLISVSSFSGSEAASPVLPLDMSKTCDNGYCGDDENQSTTSISDAIIPFPFLDGFENGNYNNWTSGSGSYTRSVTTAQSFQGSYSFTQTGGNSSTHRNGVAANFSIPQTPTEISFAVRSANASKAGGYFVLGPQDSCPIFFYMNSKGKLYINTDTSVSYTANTWYTIKLSINWTTKTINFYVNDILRGTALPFRDQVSSFTTLYLYNFDNTQTWYDDINVGNNSVSSQWLTYAPTIDTVMPGQTKPVYVTFDSKNLLAGMYVNTLTIAHNAPNVSSINVPCTLSVTGMKRLSVSPVSLNFGNLWIGRDSLMSLTFQNAGSDTTTISAIAGSNSIFNCTAALPLKIPPFNSRTVQIKFTPTIIASETCTLTVTSNAADNPSLSVTLYGIGSSAPKIAVTPPSIARSTMPDDSLTVPLLINNAGGDTLRFTAQTFTDLVMLSGNEMSEMQGGPDSSGYRWIDSDEPSGPAFRWVDISTSGQLLTKASGCDDCYDSANIGFPFPFYGNSFSRIYVSSNGYLTFGTGSAKLSNYSLPDTDMPANLIAPFFDDLDPETNGNIYFKGFNDSAIIQYTNVTPLSGSGTYTYQVVLKKNGDIYFYYNSLTGSLYSTTVGIQNASCNDGFAIVYNAAYLKNNLAIKISRNASQWLSVLPISGKVPPMGSMSLNVKLNSLDMDTGRYIGRIALTHNDPVTASPVIVPCTLTVANLTVPAISFNSSSQTVQENAGTVTVYASLTKPSITDVLVSFTVSGTANNSTDHNLTNGTFIIKAGFFEDSVKFQLTNDIIYENNEEVVLTMGTPVYAVLGANSVHTITIIDDDPAPTVQFASATQEILEKPGTAIIKMQISTVSELPVTAPVMVSGTATGNGVDYIIYDSSVTIPAGSTTGVITAYVVDDTLLESNETIVMTIGTPTNATVGTTNIHTATIIDNDSCGIIKIMGLDSTAQVYLYASSGWPGVRQFNGNGTLTLMPGKYKTAIVQKNKRTEYLLLTSQRGLIDTVDIQMRRVVPMVFDTLKRLTDANGSEINIGSTGSAVMDDIDRDGNEDLVTLSSGGTLSIYYGNNIGFQSPQTYTLSLIESENARCLRIINNNADNVVNYLVGLSTGEIVTFNSSTLARSTVYTAQNGLTSIELCDFNEDNNFDLLLGYSDGTVDYAASNGAGGFLTAVTINSETTTLSVGEDASVMNMLVDGDSLPDLLIGNRNGDVSWFKRKADGTYATKGAINGDGRAMSLTGEANLTFGYNGIGQLPKIVATDNNGYVYQSNAHMSGDFDHDGSVGFSDYMMLVNAWNTSENSSPYKRRVNLVLSPGGPQTIDFYDYMNFITVWNLNINQ